MKRAFIYLLLLPLLLVSCRKNPDAYDGYRKNIVVSQITPYSGRVRVSDSPASVSPFDTSIVAAIYSRPDNLTSLTEDFDFLFKKCHALFDRYHSYTIDGVAVNNLKTINESYGSGKAVAVDPLLFETLKEAIEFTKETDGLFNIAIGSLATLWADQIELAQKSSLYADESYSAGRLIYDDPSEPAVRNATVCVPSAAVIDEVLVLNSRTKTVTFNRFAGCDGPNQKAELTFGAVGKGKATDLFAASYPDLSVLINSGQSSVKTQNYKKGQEPWSLQVANPLYNEKISVTGDGNIAAAYFKVNPSEVFFLKGGEFNFSTSGYYNNYYVSSVDGTVRSHIVNPTTGYSVNTFDAVSVFTDSATYGDMFSTALTNSDSIAAAEMLLARLNRKFKQHAVAYYVCREEGKEVFYVPSDLIEVLQLKDPAKDKLKYDLVSEIRLITA